MVFRENSTMFFNAIRILVWGTHSKIEEAG